MARYRRVVSGLLGLVLLAAGCAAPQAREARSEPSGPGGAARPATPTRILAAVRASPASLAQRRTQPLTGSVPGLDAIEGLLSAGLVRWSDQGVVLPQLAEDVPSLDNGLWKVLADGRMETTLRIRPNARWHDGTPLT